MFVPISCGVSKGMQLSVSGLFWKNGVWPQRLISFSVTCICIPSCLSLNCLNSAWGWIPMEIVDRDPASCEVGRAGDIPRVMWNRLSYSSDKEGGEEFETLLPLSPCIWFPLPCEQKMLWHSRAVILHLCAWQCDAPASGKSALRCLKVSSQKEHWCYREPELVGRGLTLLLGGTTVLSLKRRGRILELLSFVVRREKYK